MIAHEYFAVDNEHVLNPQEMVEQPSWYQEGNVVSTWANLALDVYHRNDHYENGNARHLFVTLVSRVFETMHLRIEFGCTVIDRDVNETIAPTTELLSCMANALRWSLMHFRPGCGAYMALSWAEDILKCYQAAQTATHYATGSPIVVPLTGNETIRPTFLLILRLLEACLHRKLLTGETTAADFEQLLAILGHPELPPLPADLTPEALAARRSDTPLGAVPQVLDNSEVCCYTSRASSDAYVNERSGRHTPRA